jgi:hypothetical protein
VLGCYCSHSSFALTEQKQREWGRDSQGMGPKAQAAKKNIGHISRIKEVMSNPVEREKEAEEARKQQADKKKARKEKFEQQIKKAQDKGYLEEAELKHYITEFVDVLSEQQIRSYLHVPVHAAPPRRAKKDQLDSSLATQIGQKLQELHLKSLYELLGKAPTHSRAELERLAKELYSEMVKRPRETETTLKMELAGFAMKVFATDTTRAQYDATLEQAAITDLLKNLEEIVARTASKEVHEKQAEHFLEEAGKKGWSRVDALEELKAYASTHKWILTATTQSSVQQQKCGYCSFMNDLPRQFCHRCGQELNLDCPICGQPTEADAISCGHCGFPVGDRFQVDDSLAACYARIAKENIAEAEKLLNELELVWMVSKPRKAADKRLDAIKDCRTRLEALKAAKERVIKEEQGKRKQLVDDLERLLNQRKFYEAWRFLNRLQPKDISNYDAYKKRIDAALAEVEKLLRQVQSPAASYNERVTSCEQALAKCVDCQEAIDLLKTFPPPAPQHLKAEVKDTVVTLSWKDSSSRAMNYRIVRKERAYPSSARDGNVVQTVSGRVYDDPLPEEAIGIPIYYAVYAEYKGAISAQAALLTQPVFLTQDVSQVKVEVDRDFVRLSWQPPRNVYKIVVVRKEQQPPRSLMDQDAVRIGEFDQESLQQLVDRNVKSMHTYYYGLYCQFRDHEGRLKTTSGVTIRATPEAPPEPPEALELSAGQSGGRNEVHIRWKRPQKGEMVILRTSQPLLAAKGQQVPEAQLGQYGGERLVSSSTTYTDTWDKAGIIYYTPVVLMQQIAYMGKSQQFVCVENVRDLRYETLPSAIRLYWSWPENCEQVIVYCSMRGWPLPGDPDTSASRVSRTVYEHTGYYDLSATTNQHYYIVVAAVMQIGKQQVTAPGTRIEAKLVSKLLVNYEIGQPGLRRRKHTLRISSQTTGTLPATLLVKKRDGLPSRKEDGEVILRIDTLQIGEKEVIIELAGPYASGTFARLFLEDDNMNELVKIRQPAMQKLRLG